MDLIAWGFAGAVLLTLIAVVAWVLASQQHPRDQPAISDLNPMAPLQPITAQEVGIDMAAGQDATVIFETNRNKAA